MLLRTANDQIRYRRGTSVAAFAPHVPRLDEEAPWDQRLSGGEKQRPGLCRGAAAEHASASGKVGPGRQPTAKERRDMVIEENRVRAEGMIRKGCIPGTLPQKSEGALEQRLCGTGNPAHKLFPSA